VAKKKRQITLSWQGMTDYFIVVKRTENRSDLTIRDYNDKLSKFYSWYQVKHGDLTLEKIDADLIREYIRYLLYEHEQYKDHPYKKDKSHKIGLSPTAINIHITYLKGFFNFLYKEDFIAANPMKNINKFKVDNDTVNALTVDEVKLLFAQIDRTTFAGSRDYTVLMLMLDTGIRIGELLKLEIDDFNMQQGSITIQSAVSKVRKMRILPISPFVTKLIIHHLQQRDETWECESLFTTYEGNSLEASSFRKRIKHYAEKAGLNKRVYPYLMRHTFSLLYLTLKQGDAFSLQRMLGHSSMQMTRRYVNLKDKDLKDKHLIYSPVEAIFNNSTPKNKRI